MVFQTELRKVVYNAQHIGFKSILKMFEKKKTANVRSKTNMSLIISFTRPNSKFSTVKFSDILRKMNPP